MVNHEKYKAVITIERYLDVDTLEEAVKLLNKLPDEFQDLLQEGAGASIELLELDPFMGESESDITDKTRDIVSLAIAKAMN